MSKSKMTFEYPEHKKPKSQYKKKKQKSRGRKRVCHQHSQIIWKTV